MTAPLTVRTSLGCRALRFGAPESHQRVDAKRPELAPLDQLCTSVRQRPISQPLKRKFRSQAERPRLLRQETLDGRSEASLGIEMINENERRVRIPTVRTPGLQQA